MIYSHRNMNRDIEKIVTRYAPVYLFGSDEAHMPMDFDTYLTHSSLVNPVDDNKIIIRKPLTRNHLVREAQSGIKDWHTRALSIGSNFLYKKRTRGTTGAPLYVNTFYSKNQKHLIINYITFFGADTGKVVVGVKRIGSHMSDIEHVTVVVDKITGKLVRVYFSAHTGTEGVWIEPADLEIDPKTGKFKVYVASGSHGMYPRSGTYLRFFGFGNDIADGNGIRWVPKTEMVTSNMIAFKGNLGEKHVANFGRADWYNDESMNKGGDAPFRLRNGMFPVLIALFVCMIGAGAVWKYKTRLL